MKLASLTAINALGFQNHYQKALYAFTLLFAGTNASAKTVITPGVARIPARAAIIGTGTAQNPQFPAAAEVPAVPEVAAPAITPRPEFAGTVSIDETATEYHAIARLPYSPNLIGRGVSISTNSIGEITTPNLDLGTWLGANASATPGTETSVPTTVERYLYDRAIEIQASMTPAELAALEQPIISKRNLSDARKTPVIQIELKIPKLNNGGSYLGSVGIDTNQGGGYNE
jgi:hypothetical protein